MATLANIFNHFSGVRTLVGDLDATEARRPCDDFKLRSLPNEDVYFFVKKIDNSRVVKMAAPGARARDWKVIGGASLAAAVLIGVLLPSAYGLLAGYQVSQLQEERQRLNTERARLELEESRLVSPERLEELARLQQFVDPATDRTVYLQKTDNSLALNNQRR